MMAWKTVGYRIHFAKAYRIMGWKCALDGNDNHYQKNVNRLHRFGASWVFVWQITFACENSFNNSCMWPKGHCEQWSL